MNHLMAVFAGDQKDKLSSKIFLNESYLSGQDSSILLSLILEEIGHWIDFQLNGKDDTSGDERAVFANFILDNKLNSKAASLDLEINDHVRMEIDGQMFDLELASILFTAQQAYEIGALATLEQNTFTLTATLGSVGSRYLFISDPPSAQFFSGNNVRGTLYVVSQSNNITASYFGEIFRLVKTGSRVDALQFYDYPNGAGPADRQTPAQTIIIPIVPTSTRNFQIGSSFGSSSDPVDTYLNSLLQSSRPTIVRATTKDAIEAGGVANTSLGINPAGHVFNDGDITNPRFNYSIENSSGSPVMVTSSGQNLAVKNITNSSNLTALAGVDLAGLYGTLRINENGSWNYTLNNDNPDVQALRTTANILQDVFSYRVEDGTVFVVNPLVITIKGANDNPVAFDDYNVAKESLIEDGQANQYTSLDPLGSKAVGNILPNDTDVDKYGETKTVVNLVESAAIQSKTIKTTSADWTFVPGTTFNPVSYGDKAWFRVGSNDWRALFAADGTTQITATGPYNSTTRVIRLNGNPAFYWISGGLVVLNKVSGSTIIGFKSTASKTSTNDASMKSGTVSSSETVGTTNLTPTHSSIRDTIAIGMTVTGANVPTNTSVTNVTFDVNGNILSVELNKDLSAVSKGTTLTFVGGSSQITGRYGTFLLNSNGNYVYTPFAQNPILNLGQSWVERFFYVISDLDGVLSQTFPDSDLGSRIDAILSSKEPASLNITVFGASLDDPNAVNDTATAVEAGGTLNGTAGSNPSALAPWLLGNDTTPSGSISITSAQSYGSGTPINVSTNSTIPGIYGN
jgi:VCBS repeat-containing protein